MVANTITVLLSTLLWSDLTNRYIWLVLIITFGFGAIGYWDDYRKLVLKDSRGMPARQKYFFQSVLGLGAAIYLFASAKFPAETQLVFPFFKTASIAIGPLFIIITYFVIVGSSNAVNLTDGLDGLAIMPAVMISAALGILLSTGNINMPIIWQFLMCRGGKSSSLRCLIGSGFRLPVV